MIDFSLVVCFLLITAAASVSAVPLDELISQNDARIWGGEPVDISEVPYQVSIRLYEGGIERHFCGGSIVSNKFVVSAAHCVKGFHKANLKIVAGISKKYDHGTQFDVKEFYYHEKYNKPKHAHDISVLEVKGVIKFTDNIKPIRLAKIGQVIPDDTAVLVSGWGKTEHGEPDQLQKVVLKTFNHDKCFEAWSKDNDKIFNHDKSVEAWKNGIEITKDMICAIGNNESSCRGDSGGPMVMGKGDQAVLIGAVSWGYFQCYNASYPPVFANVAELKEWIMSKTLLQEEEPV